MGQGSTTGMADPCHFDVIVTSTPPEEDNIREMSIHGWTIVADPDYVRITTPGGFLGGIWKKPDLAVDTVLFFKVPSVDAFIEQEKVRINRVLWRDNHPRDDQPGAIIEDTVGVIWGIHEHL